MRPCSLGNYIRNVWARRGGDCVPIMALASYRLDQDFIDLYTRETNRLFSLSLRTLLTLFYNSL